LLLITKRGSPTTDWFPFLSIPLEGRRSLYLAKVTTQAHSNVYSLEENKVCAKCEESKPFSAFGNNKNMKSGKRSHCKTCEAETSLALYHERKEYFLDYQKNSPKAQQTQLIKNAKVRAKVQDVPFNITKKDLDWPTHCPVLGMELVYRGDANAGGLQAGSPTIDKILPSEGYIKGNVMVMSHLANRMKNNATPEQLRTFAEWVGATYE